MIRNFRHNGLRRFYERGERQRVPPEYADKIQRILAILDGPTPLARMRRRNAYRLHRLRGDRAGHWAVSVSANWRITFQFDDMDVSDVDLTDYH